MKRQANNNWFRAHILDAINGDYGAFDPLPTLVGISVWTSSKIMVYRRGLFDMRADGRRRSSQKTS